MNLDSIKKLCRLISDAYSVTSVCFDSKGNMLCISKKMDDYHLKSYLQQADLIYNRCSGLKEIPVIINNEAETWIVNSIIEDDNPKGIFMAGPFYFSKLTRKNAMNLASKSVDNEMEEFNINIADNYDDLPFYKYYEYMCIAKLVFSYLYNKKIDENKIKIIKPSNSIEYFDNIETNNIINMQEFTATKFIQKLDHCIRNGDLDKLKYLLDEFKLVQDKIYNKVEDILEIKKLLVQAISFAVKASMDGGLSKEVANHLGELYLHQIEDMPPIDEDISVKILFDFTERVRKAKTAIGFCTYVERCCYYIETHVNDNISVKQIADELGISHEHLSRIFKHETGMSVIEYIKKVKIDEAKYMLKYTNMTLVEISEKLAFSSQSHFSTAFKDEMKITPKRFRDNYLNRILHMKNNILLNKEELLLKE